MKDRAKTREQLRRLMMTDSMLIDIVIAAAEEPLIQVARDAGRLHNFSKIMREQFREDDERNIPDDLLPPLHLELKKRIEACCDALDAAFDTAIEMVLAEYHLDTECECHLCKADARMRRMAEVWAGLAKNARMS